MHMKRFLVTSVSAAVGYNLANMVIAPAINILPNDDGSIGAFEFLESAVIAAAVILGNSFIH